MLRKKVLLLITTKGKKCLISVLLITLITVLINAIIFANRSNDILENKSIIIDAGHGGIDSGTTDYSTFVEKDINLQIALKLRDTLLSDNVKVDMTRDGDYSLDSKNSASTSRHKRDLIERTNQFNSGKYHLFVSIHVNRSSNKNAIGPIVLYSPKLPSTELLACCIQDRLNEYSKDVLGLTLRHNVVRSDFFILSRSNIPGVIVETGFISNSREKRMLADSEIQARLAEYIKNGISDYFKCIRDINNSGAEDSNDVVPSNIINEVRMVVK